MSLQQVIFLHVPQIGQRVQFLMGGNTYTSAPVQTVSMTSDGQYQICTYTGHVYVGPCQQQQNQAPYQPTQTIQTAEQAFAQTYPPQPPNQQPMPAYPLQPQQSKAGILVAIILGLFVFIVIAGVIGSAITSTTTTSTTANDPADTTYSSSTDSTPSSSTEPSEDLSMGDWEFEYEEYATYIVGTVTNNTDRTYSYAQVEFNLYDNANNQVGSAMDNINNLEPHGTWRFKAIVLENEKVASAKFKGISAF